MKNFLNNKIAIYQAANGAVEVKLDKSKNILLLTQQEVGALFGVNKPAISKHVKNIFETKELSRKAIVSIVETARLL